MSCFKKVFLVIDDKTQFDDKFDQYLWSVLDELTFVKCGDSTISWVSFKKLLENISINKINMKDDENVYQEIEKIFDDFHDEIHELITSDDVSSSWQNAKVTPTVFIRDHKQDNKFRNHYIGHLPRIIQVLVDEKNEDPGMTRTSKVFKMGVDNIIVFTNSDENNKFGIQNVLYQNSIERKIPVFLVMDGKKMKKFDISPPKQKEELPIFKKMNVHSEEYKNKFRKSIKKLRKTYYESLKSQNDIKLIDEKEVSQLLKTKQTKVKVPTKASRKKKMKKSTDDPVPVVSMEEVEYFDEEYS